MHKLKKHYKGGGRNTYKDILGENFVTLINNFKNNKFQHYYAKYFKGYENYGMDEYDIHPYLTQYCMAVTECFRRIENPDTENSKIFEKNLQSIEDIFESFKKNYKGSSRDVKSTFYFPQIPYYKDRVDKYLAKGFNLFSSNFSKGYGKNIESDGNIMENIIKYAYLFMIQLDLDAITIDEIEMSLFKDPSFLRFIQPLFNKIEKIGAGTPSSKVKEHLFTSLKKMTKSICYIIKDKIKEEDQKKSLTKTKLEIKHATADYKTVDDKDKLISDFMGEVTINGSSYKTTKTATEWNVTMIDINHLEMKPGAACLANLYEKPPADIKEESKKFRTPYTMNIRYSENIKKTVHKTFFDSTGAPLLNFLVLFSDDPPTSSLLPGESGQDLFGGRVDDSIFGGCIDDSIFGGRVDDSIGRKILYGGAVLYPAIEELYSSIVKNVKCELGTADGVKGDTRYFAGSEIIKLDNNDKCKEVDIADSRLVDSKKAGDDINKFIKQIETDGVNLDHAYFLICTYMIMIESSEKSCKDFFQKLTLGELEKKVKEYMKKFHVLKNRLEYVKSNEKFYREIINDDQLYNKIYGDFLGMFSKKVKINDGNEFEFIDNASKILQNDHKKTNRLSDPDIYDFYENVVLKNTAFYGEFFNLVRYNYDNKAFSGQAPIDEASKVPSAERQHFRLNVKKIAGDSILSNTEYLQIGGANSNIGEIVFFVRIPNIFEDNQITALWVDDRSKIFINDLKTKSDNYGLTFICKQIYRRDVSTKKLNIVGLDFDIDEIMNSRLVVENYKADFEKIFNELDKKRNIPGIKPPTKWDEFEKLLYNAMTLEDTNWRHDFSSPDDKYGYYKYEKTGADGNPIVITAADTCGMVEKKDVMRCVNLLLSCISSDLEDGKVAQSCHQFADLNFKKELENVGNPSITEIMNQVSKMNPRRALEILYQFKFGSYLDNGIGNKFPDNIRKIKVQSLDSWLSDIFEKKSNDLKKSLGQVFVDKVKKLYEGKQYGFFSYLSVLVSWVNAHPQLLNPETMDSYINISNFPAADRSLSIFDHLNPHTKKSINKMSYDLERLKTGIANDFIGARGDAVLSFVANTPNDINTPFMRASFTYPGPNMYGGYMGIEHAKNEMEKLQKQYGYGIFKDLYKAQLNNLNAIGLAQGKNITLKNRTLQNIEKQLKKLKEAERAYQESLAILIEKNKLFKNSRGSIDVYSLKDSDFKKVLDKHSNLMSASSAYNRQARNVIDIFQTMSKAILEKYGDGESKSRNSNSKYTRPLGTIYDV